MSLLRRNDTPPEPNTTVPGEGADVTPTTTTPRSQESINRELAALRGADSHAKDCDEKATKALADADRLDQAIAGMNQRESELRAELDQLQRDRDAATKHAMDARAYAQRMSEERDEFANQAADTAEVLAGWGVTVDPDLLVPTQSMPAVAATVTDAHLDDGVARLMHHHDTDPAGERDVA